MKIEVSNGELLDKISILQLKCIKIVDPYKLQNIVTELNILMEAITHDAAIMKVYNGELFRKLYAVNTQLWMTEDAIRYKENQQEFDDQFIYYAREVYKLNDIRSTLKREINEKTGSSLVEEKQYTEYSDA